MREYIFLCDRRFLKQALDELAVLSGSARSIRQRYIGETVSIVSLEQEPDSVLKTMRDAKPIFIYGLIPVVASMDDLGTDAIVLVDAISKLLTVGTGFRIEVSKLGTEIEANAKNIEVLLGLELEKKNLIPNLMSPEVIVYLVLERKKATIGLVTTKEIDDPVIDHFRLENKVRDTVNRSEIKLKEAFEAFGLQGREFKLCLDIGAAPGGWTDFLVKKGSRVVCVDKADLDDQKVRGKKAVALSRDDAAASLKMDGIDILHLKYSLNRIEELPFGQSSFDLITIDMNKEPLISTMIAKEGAALLKEGGFLIMMIKLQEPNQVAVLGKVREELAGSYSLIRMKKLHHNRTEIALFATKA